MRLPARAAAASAALATLLAAGCAPRHAEPTASGQDPSRAGLLFGTIVAMRPLAARAPIASLDGILGAIGGAADTRAVEFIIRADTGETISIVQTTGENFRPGERVAIIRGARARLARGPLGERWAAPPGA